MAQTLTITTAATEQATTWTPEEIAACKALWTAVVARLAATLPVDTYEEMTAYLAAVEAEVGCTLADLQQAISQAAGPAPVCVRAVEKPAVVMVTYGHFDGEGDVRGCECDGVSLGARMAA